jgi:hypothetical protein
MTTQRKFGAPPVPDESVEKRFRGLRHGARGIRIDAASQHESALGRIRDAGLSGVGPIAPASAAMYTSTEREIAIDEQTECSHAAEDAFCEELATVSLDGIVDVDFPGVCDVGHLWTAASDVWMWHSSLTTLATLYGANDGWSLCDYCSSSQSQ